MNLTASNQSKTPVISIFPVLSLFLPPFLNCFFFVAFFVPVSCSCYDAILPTIQLFTFRVWSLSPTFICGSAL